MNDMHETVKIMRMGLMRLIGLIILAAIFCCQPAFAMRGEQPAQTRVAAAIGAANSAGGIRAVFEKRRKALGGKGAWQKVVVEALAEKIGFKYAPSRYLAIQEVWKRFIEEHRDAVYEGNSLIQKDIQENGSVSEQTLARLEKIMVRMFQFSDKEGQLCGFSRDIQKLIRMRAKELKGRLIVRSSGFWEDNYDQSLAGVFISPVIEDWRQAAQALERIFYQAIEVIWIGQNKEGERLEGLPNTLSAEEGFAVVIQPFLSFDSSGTAVSNRHGYTTIEAVIGDAVTAVRPQRANITQFLFEKGRKEVFEYNPTYVDTPYEFILKGKRYCQEENRDEMKVVLAACPKIGEVFSPITEGQARELNRVVNALEKEFGTPVDVEWGFLDGELYIIQVRPVPRKAIATEPLVVKSAELEAERPIATTPTAYGQTGPNGFTGRMVLFGNVDRETVKRFEEEFGMEYIRVQDNVDVAVLRETTKSKVLVDISQSGTGVHSFKAIEARVNQGEFCYANSPILRRGFMQNLEFIPHPEFKAVWVSKQDVTYFGDGIRGSFYIADEGVEIKPQTDRQRILMQFYSMTKDIWFNDEEDPVEVYTIIPKLLLYGPYATSANAKLTLDLFCGVSDNLEYVRASLNQGWCDEEGLDLIQPQMDLLDEALSCPLYPKVWESQWMKRYVDVSFLKGAGQAVRDAREKGRKMEMPDEYRAVFIETYVDRSEVRRAIEDRFPGCNIISLSDAAKNEEYDIEILLESIGYQVNFFYIHVRALDIPFLIRLFTEIRKKNPGATIFIESRMPLSDKAEVWRFKAQYGHIYVFDRGVASNALVERVVIRDFQRWQAAHPAPAPPEKLRMLYVDDSITLKWRGLKLLFQTEFGAEKVQEDHYSGPEYELFFASNQKEALQTLDSQKINYLVVDWILAEESPVAVLGVAVEKGIQFVDIDSMDKYVKGAQQAFSVLDIYGFPMDNEGRAGRIREVRRQQLEAWEKAHPEALRQPQPAVKDDRETMFIVSGSKSEADYLAEFINEEFRVRFNIVYIDTLWKLKRELAGKAPDLVITDTILDRKDSLDEIYQLVNGKNPNARFIIASKVAAILPQERLQGKNIIAVFEAPFYFQAVIELLRRQPKIEVVEPQGAPAAAAAGGRLAEDL